MGYFSADCKTQADGTKHNPLKAECGRVGYEWQLIFNYFFKLTFASFSIWEIA